jgi:hypothetical protein
MASSLNPTRLALAAFLAGGAFRPLWAVVMDAAPRIDADPQVSEHERDAFDELYDLVCAATGDPLDVDGAEVVETDAAELRAQIRELGLERLGAPPA